MKTSLRWILLRLLLLPLLLTGCAGGGSAPATPALETAALAKGDLTASVVANGTVRPARQAEVTWEAPGQVGEVLVTNQTTVVSGQKLAGLLESSLPVSVINARVELAEARLALEQLKQSRVAAEEARLNVVEARDALDKATIQLNSVSGQKRFVTDAYLDGVRAELMMAESEVEEAQNGYDHVAGLPDDNPEKAAALKYLSEMKRRRDQAQYNLNYVMGHPTDKEIDRAQAEHALATARMEDAQRAYERVKDGVPADELAAAEARVKVAQATLDQVELKAPFAGFITRLEMHPGDIVQPGALALTMEDQSHIYIDAQVSEVDINHVQEGQVVTVTFDAVYGKEYHGKVIETGASGVSTQGVVNFPIRVELVDHDEQVKSGMTAVLRIQVQEVKDVLLVPNRAVRILDGQRVVYVQRGPGLPRPVAVTLGVSSETMSQLLSGELNPGDLVVLNPDFLLQSGITVSGS